MATVTVPNLGDSVPQATLLRWHKQDGEMVNVDEPICELETDKANADVPATAKGIFKRAAGLEPGAVVKVGQPLGDIDPNGKASAPAAAAPASPAASGAGSAAVAATSGASGAAVASAKNGDAAKPQSADTGRAEELSPAVRRMIEENKLDPARIAATGPGGRLTKEDVIKHVEAMSAPTQPKGARAADVDPNEGASTLAPAAAAAASGVTRTPMSKLRKRIAENLVRAQQTAAILTTFNEVDLSKVMDLLTKYN
jgi:2-oxoglutarate dehydrogenase E2 component (dihydrolipoamide succinyltransferase)